jgi:hypothetical protein
MLKDRMYSITDVVFEDAGDREVPREYLPLFNEYCAEVEWLPVATPLWCSIESNYTTTCLLEKGKHKAYTRSLLCSGDSGKIEAAIEAMKRLLLKWDSSSGIAKMNQQAYAAREQKKLRDKSDPKIRAWEAYTARNPYYPDEESLQAMQQREEQKLMQRVEEYNQKWRSNPCAVQEPQVGEDGYMLVQMPEGWGRPQG